MQLAWPMVFFLFVRLSTPSADRPSGNGRDLASAEKDSTVKGSKLLIRLKAHSQRKFQTVTTQSVPSKVTVGTITPMERMESMQDGQVGASELTLTNRECIYLREFLT